MILLLVRHAVTEVTGKKLIGRLPGFSLSAKGREQAESVARRLSGAPVKAVYSSPLERCSETAALIAKAHGLPLNMVEDLGEIGYGDWQGKSLKVLYRSRLWKDLKARPGDFRFPGGETIREAQTRAMNAVEDLRARHKQQAVVVCSHADVIRALVAGYLGLGIDLYSRISIAPASVTAIVLGERAPQLVVLGESGSYDEIFEKAAPKPRSAKADAAVAAAKPSRRASA